MKYKDLKSIIKTALLVFVVLLAGTLVTWGMGAGQRVYSVWSSKKQGEADLAHAMSHRQIKTLEAKQAMESAVHLAEAEITRAKGVAEANRIIGDSLQGNESYLKYLWVQGLQTNQMQVVYVPTEANLPILEAGKR